MMFNHWIFFPFFTEYDEARAFEGKEEVSKDIEIP
jgi:hypothetical protein